MATSFRATFKRLEGKLLKATAETTKNFANDLKKEVLNSISQGKSPVAGEGPYQKYSDSYKKQFRRLGKTARPVNLKVTGKMLNSFKVRALINGFVLWFTSPIAKYHNGEGRVDRIMLPGEGQTFNKNIIAKLRKRYARMVRSAFK